MASTLRTSCDPCAAWGASVGEGSGPESSAAEVRVRYFAAAADAAGREEELLEVGSTVGDLRTALIDRYGDAMARVLASGSFLIDGVVSREDSRELGSRVDVLPPFAGG